MARRSQKETAVKKRPTTKKAEAPTSAQAVVRILNCTPSRDTEKDYQFDNAAAAGLVEAEAPIPQARDLREAWWEIGDQGSTGSCVGWATADSVLRWHFVKAGRLRPIEHLSPRFIWMAAKETDEFTSQPETFIEVAGTSIKCALDIARNYGAVKDEVLPFDVGHLYQGKTATFYALAAQLKIASYINLGRDLTSWRRWIASNGPILTRLTCDSVWMNAKATGGKLDVYDPLSARGGHAVALVGYDQNMFIVRNSWGVEMWGDGGFAYASNAYAAAAFTEAYGVNVT